MPLLVIPYTTFCVSFWLEMMHTASAWNSFTMRYVSLTMSGFPCLRVSVPRHTISPTYEAQREERESAPTTHRR